MKIFLVFGIGCIVGWELTNGYYIPASCGFILTTIIYLVGKSNEN